ncbi:MAG: T9SS type A sorting domain-containing protein [Muribaculaceae bacterium]|nr:T9SS type A sorting domain-containing protein [Muribaculaceae bacterium]
MLKKIGIFTCSFLLAFGSSLTAQAQNAVKMIPGATTGEDKEIIFLLRDTPTVTFDDDAIVVECNDEKVVCNLQGGVSFEFIAFDEASVDAVESDSTVIKINQLFIGAYNLSPDTPVVISDLSGKILSSSKTDPHGHIYVSLYDFPTGVYIFSSKDKNFKFYKK